MLVPNRDKIFFLCKSFLKICNIIFKKEITFSNIGNGFFESH